jgi:hypothetical protein
MRFRSQSAMEVREVYAHSAPRSMVHDEASLPQRSSLAMRCRGNSVTGRVFRGLVPRGKVLAGKVLALVPLGGEVRSC